MDLSIVKKNLNDMLKDRDYKFIEKDDEEGYWIYYKKNKKNVIIFFANDQEKVGVDYVKNVITKTEDKEIPHLILISSNKLTSHANKHILLYPMKIEFFLYDELKFNITNHSLVPKHVLLSDKESCEIIEYYGKKNLPQIKHRDIVSRYFNAEVGQVFRIYRNEGGIFYRLVT
jgi:DNA-directed RNA polymerase I, II, and III subunit RPABC1